MNPQCIAYFLDKPPVEFTRKDLVRFIEKNKIQMLNFRYVGGDGKLKTLNFIIKSKAQLNHILSAGERVDGSSLFPYIDAASSDLYVIPRYRTAYVNPFANIPTMDILCSYYTSSGVPLPSAPEYVVCRAQQVLKDKTGFTLEAMGELEYYILSDTKNSYTFTNRKGYHESAPFTRWENLRTEAMDLIARVGGEIKYGHAEVGHICSGNREIEQHEIEFSPVPVEDAADGIVIAKWILRMLGAKYGVTITFAPKILVGYAGSGLHIHSRLVKDGKNFLIKNNKLTDNARRLIAGYLKLAGSLTAFGNTVPISYLRLVPHQEAPTKICWGDRNRSVLVRIPLGWLNTKDMIHNVNPKEKGKTAGYQESQTVEFRCPDGSADIHLLLAGLAVAARYGLEMKDALETARKLYVDVNIFSAEQKKLLKSLQPLPASCGESAECLLKDRRIYEENKVFSPVVIDGLARKLKGYHDKHLSQELYGKKAAIKKLLSEHLHCG